MAFVPLQFQKYPGLERQDFTQGQLGSFKFTPVDRENVPLHPQKYLTDSLLTSSTAYQMPLGRQQKTSPLQTRQQNGLSTEMNPIASTFVPIAPPSSPRKALISDLGDITVSTQTMFRALETEQEAHKQTQILLEEAQCRLREAEIKNQKMSNQIRSLVQSVNMLGSIIKHNQSKNENESVTDIKPPSPALGHQPIIHDVLARRKAEYERQRCSMAESDSISDATVQLKGKDAASQEPFNLNLLRSPTTSTDSVGEALSQRLRKHFTLDASSDGQGQDALPFMNKEPNAAISRIQPEQVRTTDLTESSKLLQVSNATEVELVEKPTLQLPSSFLSKYQVKSKKVVTMEDDGAMMPTRSSPDTAIPVNGHDTGERLTGPTSVGSPNTTARGLNLVNSQSLPSSKSDKTQKLVDDVGPIKLNIKWNVTAENPVYEDDTEKVLSLGIPNVSNNQHSRFWKHPVRYIEYAEKNLFRTVMIDYIPLGATYQHVLANIYGGALEKIELYEPIGQATDYMTARIVFHYELAASVTASYARDHQMKIKGKSVRVWQVITQTYPKSRELERQVFEYMYTRLLLVNLKTAAVTEEVKDQMRALLPVKLDWLRSSIIEISKTSDGYDLIEFTSVKAATQAMEQLRKDEDFGGIQMDFEDDPCAEPYPFGGWEL